ncbi:MAG: carboxy terminal-processing peptidase [Gammaproteobacteria bacterium]
MRLTTLVFGLSLSLAATPVLAAGASTSGTSAAAASAPAAASAKIAVVAPATNLAPEPRQVLIGRTVVHVMQAHHYPAETLDQALSEKILKQYFDALDPNRFFFTQADITRFSKYDSTLASDLKHGNLKPAYAIYDAYIERVNRQIHYALGLLDEEPNLSGNESFRFSRDHAPWAKNVTALDTVWRQRVDNDILSLLLTGKTWKSTKQTLTRRYTYALNHINQTKSNDVFDAYMNAYAQTEDPHSSYFSPFDAQQFRIAMSLQLEGVGAQLTEKDNYVTIVRILPGGPAAESKALKAGDRIVAVGEGKKGAMKDVVGRRLDDVVKMIRGPKGSTVRLKILPAGELPGGAEKTLTLVRNTIKLNAEHAHARVALVKHGDVAYKIGIITIPSFYVNFKAEGDGSKSYTSVSRDVAALIKDLKQKKVSGILLDLRNNGGGSLQEATALTGLFIPDGPVVQIKDRSGNVQVLATPRDEKVAWRGPLALLINRFSASATEIFAGALKDYHRALIIGSDTWGKGTVQQLIQLDSYLPGFKAGELKLTTAQFFRVNGASTQRRGVKPEISIPSAIDDKKFGESSLPDALPWQQIQAADYQPVKDGLDSVLPKIANYYKTVLQKDSAFQLYVKQVGEQREQAARTEVSLNLKQRKAERAKRHADQLALVNDWRKLAGKKTFKTLKAANDADFDVPDVPLQTSARLLGEYIVLRPGGASAQIKIRASHRPGKISTCLQKLQSVPVLISCGKPNGKGAIIYPPSARTDGTGSR